MGLFLDCALSDGDLGVGFALSEADSEITRVREYTGLRVSPCLEAALAGMQARCADTEMEVQVVCWQRRTPAVVVPILP